MKVTEDEWVNDKSSTKEQDKNFKIARTFAKKHRHKTIVEDTTAIGK